MLKLKRRENCQSFNHPLFVSNTNYLTFFFRGTHKKKLNNCTIHSSPCNNNESGLKLSSFKKDAKTQ